ncbi:hypothetical protein PV08_00977 [Exophiala spinifera]|uniref:Uncharacterized protein n=1 Tax=Exophiala spinifera TaxID=91928 RepID=A0A0D2A6K6_9EURO|nr:uncharacterized protein PV08_00977 [Exophiala spinifera]KIW20402.1 hypothetical protein PV08_00977 [Exophiala spinifera]
MATERPDASRDFSTCEVLVHITAPSSAQDDARFTSVAAALLNFQPAKRAKVAELDFISSHPVPTNTEINATEQEPFPKQR